MPKDNLRNILEKVESVEIKLDRIIKKLGNRVEGVEGNDPFRPATEEELIERRQSYIIETINKIEAKLNAISNELGS